MDPAVSIAPRRRRSSAAAAPVRPWPVALAMAAWLLSGPAQAQQLPVGAQVVSGVADISTAGNAMTIKNSPNAILNWQGFSIGQKNSVNFEQPNATSQVLNRVVGTDPSQILGSLTSNGKVWLLNPHGILFGKDARIDVGGLVASTLEITDADFLAGRFNFAGDGAGVVTNQGQIATPFGGSVYLIGGSVANEGLIHAPGGEIVLAAGHSVDLIDTGTPNLTVRVTAPDGQAVNLGTLIAESGRIDIHAATVNQEGIVRADSATPGADGRIVLKASLGASLGAASVTSANGPAGGSVTVDAGQGTTLVSGSVSASGGDGPGGRVQLLGRQVGVIGHAQVDASGATGGGSILVGGDYQGKNPAVSNAEAVFFGRDAVLAANATGQGDGGRIVLWSDSATRAYGTLLAQGGPRGGNGGLIETSSAGFLDANPLVVGVNAPLGQPGTWLLDPPNLTIMNNSDGDFGVTGGPNFTATSDGAVLSAETLTSALNNGANVVVQTGSAGGECCSEDSGDLTILEGTLINPTTANPRSLTLKAYRDIQIAGATISSANAPMDVTLTSDKDGTGNGAISVHSGSSIITSGGSITMNGGGADGRAQGYQGIAITGSTLDAGSGDVHLRAAGGTDDGGFGVGIRFSSITAQRIEIDGTGELGPGVVIFGSTLDAQTVSLTGASLQDTGVVITGSTITAGEMAAITGLGAFQGVTLDTSLGEGDAPAEIIGTGQASITVTGFASNSGASGIAFFPGASTIRVGTGAGGSYSGDIRFVSDGISFFGSGTEIASTGTVQFLPYTPGASLSLDADELAALSTALQPGFSRIQFGDATTSGITVSGQLSVADPVLFRTSGLFQMQAGDSGGITFIDVVSLAALSPFDSQVTSTAPGNAIVVAAGRFENLTGAADALNAPNGRWLVYSTSPGEDSLGGLSQSYAFMQHGISFEQTPAGGGNGLLYSDGQSLALQLAKVYDTSLSIPIDNQHLKPGQGIDIVAPTAGLFADPNVGQGKPVSFASPFAVANSDGKPEYFGPTFLLAGDITPATLTYLATPASGIAGLGLPPLDGTIVGFLGGDTPGTATVGTLSWTTPATVASPPGRYPVAGGGLSATNYVFAQDSGNSRALTMVSADGLDTAIKQEENSAAQAVAGATRPRTVVAGVADSWTPWVIAAIASDIATAAGFGAGQSAFQRLDLSSLTRDAMTDIVARRHEFKKQLFADAIYKLEEDPQLADVPPCVSLKDSDSGLCIMTEAQVHALKGRPAIASSTESAAQRNQASKESRPTVGLPQIHRKVALLIGINNYQQGRIPKLESAIPDVDAVGRLLRQELGYEVRVLRDPRKSDLVSAFNQLARDALPGDSVAVYYAGHGYLVDKTRTGYWLPADASIDDPRTWISNSDVSKFLKNINANQVVMISDSCYSGIFAEKKDLFAKGASSGTADEILTKRSVVVMSSGGEEPVSDEGKDGHSVFAWNLMRVLQNVTNWNPGVSIFEEVQKSVVRDFPQTPQYGGAVSAGHQAGGDYLFEIRQFQ